MLPPGEKKTQKVAVGDAAGVVQCFSVKRGEVALSFKGMPGRDKVREYDACDRRTACSHMHAGVGFKRSARLRSTARACRGATRCEGLLVIVGLRAHTCMRLHAGVGFMRISRALSFKGMPGRDKVRAWRLHGRMALHAMFTRRAKCCTCSYVCMRAC